MAVDPALAPYLCIGPLLLVVLVLLLGILFSGKVGKPPDGYSPEEQQALVRQGNALGFPFILFLVSCGLFELVKEIFPAVNNPSVNSSAQSIVAVAFLALNVGAVIYVSISSIRNRISIARGRGQREYPRGGSAVWAGISFLIIGLVTILVWWLSVTGQK